MKRRSFVGGLMLGTLAAPLAGQARQTGSVARIGILRPGSPPDPYIEAFQQGLRELGYAEGRNIEIEYRWAEGRDSRLPALAADLVRLKMDVIVASGAAPVLAAKQATATIPIVMPVIGDPVRLGLVASYARPGANVTGFAVQNDELAGKWVQLLKEALPNLSRVALLADPASEGQQVKTAEVAARHLGMQTQILKVDRVEVLETSFAGAKRNHAEALIVLGSPLFSMHRIRVIELAARYRYRRCITNESSSWVRADSCPMERTSMTSFGAPQHMWTSLSTLAVSIENRLLSISLPRDLQCTSSSDEWGIPEYAP